MKITKTQEHIISAVSNYILAEKKYNELTKEIKKPIWIGEGTEENIREAYISKSKYWAVLVAVCEALNTPIDDAFKITEKML